jgi:hypothetical protein
MVACTDLDIQVQLVLFGQLYIPLLYHIFANSSCKFPYIKEMTKIQLRFRNHQRAASIGIEGTNLNFRLKFSSLRWDSRISPSTARPVSIHGNLSQRTRRRRSSPVGRCLGPLTSERRGNGISSQLQRLVLEQGHRFSVGIIMLSILTDSGNSVSVTRSPLQTLGCYGQASEM